MPHKATWENLARKVADADHELPTREQQVWARVHPDLTEWERHYAAELGVAVLAARRSNPDTPVSQVVERVAVESRPLEVPTIG